MKAVILGSRGLVGRALAEKLKNSFELLLIDISPRMADNPAINYVQSDITKDDFFQALLEIKPHLIVNCVNIATIFSETPSNNYRKLLTFYLNLYDALVKMNKNIHYIQVGQRALVD